MTEQSGDKEGRSKRGQNARPSSDKTVMPNAVQVRYPAPFHRPAPRPPPSAVSASATATASRPADRPGLSPTHSLQRSVQDRETLSAPRTHIRTNDRRRITAKKHHYRTKRQARRPNVTGRNGVQRGVTGMDGTRRHPHTAHLPGAVSTGGEHVETTPGRRRRAGHRCVGAGPHIT